MEQEIEALIAELRQRSDDVLRAKVEFLYAMLEDARADSAFMRRVQQVTTPPPEFPNIMRRN
jgi:hypothetical protein